MGVSNITTNYELKELYGGQFKLLKKIPNVKFFSTEGSVIKIQDRYRDLNNLTIESTLINQKGFSVFTDYYHFY